MALELAKTGMGVGQRPPAVYNFCNTPVADRASGGQQACPGKWKKCRKKKMKSNTNVMYIHVCHVSCNIVVMFTCTLVRSHPDSRRHWGAT
jgi:hypothetical protein